MLPDKPECGTQLPITETVVLSKFNVRRKPKLRFTIRTVDMNMHARLLTREKVETEAASAKNGWTHSTMLHPLSCLSPVPG